jgi:hypothetical protein
VTVFVSGQVKNSPRLGKYVADVRSFPADAVLSYRLAGMRGIWNALAERTIHRVLRTGHVMVFAQQLESAPEVLAPAGVIIRALRDNDWPALSRIATQRSLASFRLLAATGRHCLVAWRGAEAIGYGWVAERIGTDVTACPVAMPPDAASARVQLARRLGFREGWRMIAPENAASLRTLAKTGTHTRTVGELRFIKIFASVHGRLRPAAFPDRVT